MDKKLTAVIIVLILVLIAIVVYVVIKRRDKSTTTTNVGPITTLNWWIVTGPNQNIPLNNWGILVQGLVPQAYTGGSVTFPSGYALAESNPPAALATAVSALSGQSVTILSVDPSLSSLNKQTLLILDPAPMQSIVSEQFTLPINGSTVTINPPSSTN